MSFACAPFFAFFIGGAPELAGAGEFDRSTLPAAVADPARCDSGGEGLGVLSDSADCKRISGYIAAGARFGPDQIGAAPSPFGPLEAPEFVGSVRPAGGTIVDAPAGQDRLFPAPAPGDEAR